MGILYALVLFAGLAFQSPAYANMPKFMILTAEPQNNTFVTVYPEIEDLHESDHQCVLIAEIQDPQKTTYSVTVQIKNSNGKIIYNEQKNLEIKLNIKKSYLYYPIALDNELKSKLIPGSLWVRLNIDGKAYKDKNIQYNKQSLISKNIPKAVILPFYSSLNQFFDTRLKDEILNTFADIIRIEMQRIAPEVISSEISGPKLSKLKIKGCLDRAACRDELINIFTEGVFITGDVNIPKLDLSAHATDKQAFLTLFIYSFRTKESATFRADRSMRLTDTEPEVMRALIQDILNQEGFSFHVKNFL